MTNESGHRNKSDWLSSVPLLVCHLRHWGLRIRKETPRMFKTGLRIHLSGQQIEMGNSGKLVKYQRWERFMISWPDPLAGQKRKAQGATRLTDLHGNTSNTWASWNPDPWRNLYFIYSNNRYFPKRPMWYQWYRKWTLGLSCLGLHVFRLHPVALTGEALWYNRGRHHLGGWLSL